MLKHCSAPGVIGRVVVTVFCSLSAMTVLAEPEVEAPVAVQVAEHPQESTSTTESTQGESVPTNTATDAPIDLAAPELAAPAEKLLYKSVDAKGNVTFTDVPPAGKTAVPIKVQATNKMPVGVSQQNAATVIDGSGEGEGGRSEQNNKNQQASVAVKYKSLQITSPVNDAYLGQDAQSVTITAALEPELQNGHNVQLYYDGNPVGSGAMSYTVTQPERGTHTVEAKVFDSKKKLLKSSEKVQFHVRRISALNKLTATPLPANGKDKNAPPKPTAPAGGFGAPKGFNGPGDANAPKAAASGRGAGSSRDAGSPGDVGSPGTRR